MPTNQQIYDKLNAIEALLMQLLNALNDDNETEPMQRDLNGDILPSDRPDNQEL